MNHGAVLTSLCIASVFLLSWRSPLCAQEAPGNAQRKPNPIEGIWVELIWDTEKGAQSMLPDRSAVATFYIWKISKDTIERGGEDNNFRKYPKNRMRYDLNPGKQEGAIDLLPLNEDKDKKKGLAIYFVKDDYMIICLGKDSRPKSFTISKDNPNRVHILRRHDPKSSDPDSVKPKGKDK